MSLYLENRNKRVFENVRMNDILNFIDEIEVISISSKEFYKKLIQNRYDIIKKVYKFTQISQLVLTNRKK